MGMSSMGETEDADAKPGPAELVEQGRAHHREGRLDEAERLYRQALDADEEFAEAHQLMAVLAAQRGRLDEAIAGFRRTIALDGPTPDRLYNLAEAYRVSGNFQSALEAYNQALGIDASYVDAYRSGAAMLKESVEHARAAGDGAAELRLRRIAAHYLVGLGQANLRTNDVRAAEQAYLEASDLDPDNVEAYNSLGTIAFEAAKPVEAEMLYRRATGIDPKSPLYLTNLGRSLRSQLRLTEAADLFRQAVDIDPTFTEARIQLEERGLPWFHFRSDLNPSAVFAAHRDGGRRVMERAAEIAITPPQRAKSRNPDRPLTIAYLGVDISSPLDRACVEPLLTNHDPSKIKALIYATAGSGVENLRHFRKLGAIRGMGAPRTRAQEAIKTIAQDGTDIIVDLAGHLPHNRLDLLAHKPAPVAVSWLGYPDTTGLSTVDYRITDEVLDPPGAEEFYTERLYRLTGGSLVYRPPEGAPAVSEVPARAPGAVTFGCFDDPRKISPEAARAWSLILEALPKARLTLMAPEFADAGFAARIQSVLESAGIDASRVAMRLAPVAHMDMLQAYAAIDIALDTFPFNVAYTTICEALWMGVPVITLSGDRTCGRTSSSVLSQLGLERLNSQTAEEYAETAIELAADLDRLRTLRAGMRERMRVSPLMDERGFARRFETALRHMWREWCTGKA
jgi:predicted O-linked N-acetylglucosamine transferase (SPINDLY family)